MLQAEGFRDTVDRLETLGLKAKLAEAYLHLLTQSRMRPGALAMALQTSRADAYRRLQRLAELDLAIPGGGRPITYGATDPGDLLDTLHRCIERQAASVRVAQDELEPFLATLAGSDAAMANRTFRYVTGHEAYDAEVHRLLDDAEGEVLMVDTHAAGAESAERAGLWERFRHLAEAGRRQRILMADTAAARRHAGPGTLRTLPTGDVIRFVIADQRVMVLGISHDETGAGSAPLERYIITAAPGFIAAHRVLFRRLWSQGVEIVSPTADPAGTARTSSPHMGASPRGSSP